MRDHGGVTFDELGPNSGLVEDLYERFREDPTVDPGAVAEVLHRASA